MITQEYPRDVSGAVPAARLSSGQTGARLLRGQTEGRRERHGPLCVHLHPAHRCEGAGFHPRALPQRADARGADTLYCHPSLAEPALDAGGAKLLEEIDTLISRYPPYSEAREELAAALYGTSETLRIDPEGRVVLTETLKDHAGIGDSVSFVGWVTSSGSGSRNACARTLPRPRTRCVSFGVRSVPQRRMEAARDEIGPRGRPTDAAGGPARHLPVMLAEVLAHLAPKAAGSYVDGTFGAGGYSRAILEAADCRLLAIDRDPTAIAGGAPLVSASGGRLVLVEDRFSQLDIVAGEQGFAPLDGVVLDIGVSSMQLDEAERGFSFRRDGPLDMRMGADGPSAADLVAELDEVELAHIIYTLGEERLSRHIARAIVKARDESPILRTSQLADIVSRVVRTKPGEMHPATRTFQALRIAVNGELDELVTALAAAERALKPVGGSSSSPSIRSKTGSLRFFWQTGQRRPPPRATCRRPKARPRPSGWLPRERWSRDRRKSPPIPAHAPQSCARRSGRRLRRMGRTTWRACARNRCNAAGGDGAECFASPTS